MKDLDFFNPPDPSLVPDSYAYPAHTLGHRILRAATRHHLPEEPCMVLIGLDDYRPLMETRPVESGFEEQPENLVVGADRIRQYLYELSVAEGFPLLADLGNMIPGQSPEDTQSALASVTSELLEQGHFPVWIGGRLDFLRGIFQGFSGRGPTDVSVVSARTHFQTGPDAPAYSTVLRQLVEKDSTHLFNLSCLAFQSHWSEPEENALLEQMRFEQLRLGALRQHPEKAEPLLRSSHLSAFSLSAVRWSDADGNPMGGPNGLWAHELCQLCHYAGANDLLRVAFFCDYQALPNDQGTGAATLAQALWYLIEGFSQRCDDVPKINSRNFTRYTMALQGNHELIFIKSQKSGRWWLEVTLPVPKGSKRERALLVPCTYDDYLQASSDELPDRWWRIHQKYLL